jgi:hypothetical protein
MGGVGVRRAFLADTRGGDRHLCVTWHPTSSTVVFSHWVDDVCVGSTRVELDEASSLIALLVDALREGRDGGDVRGVREVTDGGDLADATGATEVTVLDPGDSGGPTTASGGGAA